MAAKICEGYAKGYDSQMEGADRDDFIRFEFAKDSAIVMREAIRALITAPPTATEVKQYVERIKVLEDALNKIKSYEEDLMKTKLSSCLVHIANKALSTKPLELKG